MRAIAEPCARRTIFAGFRYAASDVFGRDALQQVAELMSDEARRRCIDVAVIDEEMLPERFVLEWYEAAWEGLAERDRDLYNRFLTRMMDHGFGRVRKLLLGMATPVMLAQKASQLWRHDHSHGELTCHTTGERSLQLQLRDHVYVDTPLARSSIAEIYRYVGSLSRRKNVTSKHFLKDERILAVNIEWD